MKGNRFPFFLFIKYYPNIMVMKLMGYQNKFTTNSTQNYNEIYKPLNNICQNRTSIITKNIQHPGKQLSVSNYNNLRNTLKMSIMSKSFTTQK